MAKASKATSSAKKRATQANPKSAPKSRTGKTKIAAPEIVITTTSAVTEPAPPAAKKATRSRKKAPKPIANVNLLASSEKFDTPPWFAARAVIVPNATTAPDGKLTASKLIEGKQTGQHHCFTSFNFQAGTQYTFSVFVKAGERTKGVIVLGNGSSEVTRPCTCTYDLSAKTATKNRHADAASIIPLDDGWFRVSVTATAVVDVTNVAFVSFLHNGAGIKYTGDGESGLFLWGAQLEIGSGLTDYAATFAA